MVTWGRNISSVLDGCVCYEGGQPQQRVRERGGRGVWWKAASKQTGDRSHGPGNLTAAISAAVQHSIQQCSTSCSSAAHHAALQHSLPQYSNPCRVQQSLQHPSLNSAVQHFMQQCSTSCSSAALPAVSSAEVQHSCSPHQKGSTYYSTSILNFWYTSETMTSAWCKSKVEYLLGYLNHYKHILSIG